MRNILVVIMFFLLMLLTLSAKEKVVTKIPEAVKSVFVKKYPNAKEIKWTKEGNGYEVEFNNNGTKTSLDITGSGAITATETTIIPSELPKGIEEYIMKNNKGYKLTEAAKIVNQKGNITFEAEISKGKVKKDLIFDKDGNYLKK